VGCRRARPLRSVVGEAWTCFEGLDAALIAHGVLPDQAAAEASLAETLTALDVNAPFGDRRHDQSSRSASRHRGEVSSA
jgi:hypothetical protein